jgi:hypothetical protein
MIERPDPNSLLLPPDVPLDQTSAYFDWEGQGPPSAKRRQAWDFRLIKVLAGGWRRKSRHPR